MTDSPIYDALVCAGYEPELQSQLAAQVRERQEATDVVRGILHGLVVVVPVWVAVGLIVWAVTR